MCRLCEGERLDDLQRNGLVIIQKERGFKFGMDAVLLSGYARVHPGERVIDLCSGNGIIPLLLSAKTEAAQIVGLELQEEIAEMAQRSVAYNAARQRAREADAGEVAESEARAGQSEDKSQRGSLADRVEIVCGDVRNAVERFGASTFDVVTCNPPYMKGGHGLENRDDAKTIARHEVRLTLPEVVAAAAKLVRPKGRVYFVHRPFRLTELIVEMQQNDIEAKRMRLVCPYADSEPNMVLVEGIRGAKPYLTVEKPLIVYDKPDVYTKEILDTYGY